MVELICVVVAHVYIEQCIDILNVFKVNCKGYRVTLFAVSLVFIVNLIMFVTYQRKFFSLIPRRSKSHWLKCCGVELKTALREFVGLITAVSNISQCQHQRHHYCFYNQGVIPYSATLMPFNNSVFTSRLEPSPCRVYCFYC